MKKQIQKVRKTIEIPKLVISYDDDAWNPRDCDENLGSLCMKRYNVDNPDRFMQIIDEAYRQNPEDAWDHAIKIRKILEEEGYAPALVVPISVFDHGFLKFMRGEYSDWDIGVAGFYIVTKDDIKRYGLRNPTWDEMCEIIDRELDDLTRYSNGQIYRYTLFDDEGNVLESCGGFYSLEDMKAYLPEEFQDCDLEDYFCYDGIKIEIR